MITCIFIPFQQSKMLKKCNEEIAFHNQDIKIHIINIESLDGFNAWIVKFVGSERIRLRV